MPKHHATYYNLDLTGQKFNRLTVLHKVEGCRSKWLCKCDCGNYKEVNTCHLLRGNVKSCGCLDREIRAKLPNYSIKHGMTETILYKKWRSMKERCHNPNYKYYHRYGGRGIKICDEWLGEHGFENFAKWAYEAGYDDNKHTFEQTLDRKNTDGNYCPENCKWSNQIEQVRNRSNAFLITDIDGERLTSTQFDKKHNITADMFAYRRAKKGKSAQEILDEWNEYLKYNDGNYYSTKEASKYFGVCVATLMKWIKSGQLEAIYVRNQYYIPKGQPRPA